MKSDLMIDLQIRGFIHNCSDLDGLDSILATNKVAVYCGYDCTSDSLHVGSMMTLQVLKRFHDDGHKVIALIGTGTTMIGDPSGKDTQRPLMSVDQIMVNAAGIERCIKQIIPDIEIVHNHEWLNGNFLDMLREITPFISVNHLLTLDSVKNRLDREQPMSLLELMYPAIQGTDFFHLSQQHLNMVQIGGSDQWGNIVMGLELIRKKSGKGNAFALTHPLLLTADGKKMGKTESGAVWLSEEKLSNFDFWQFWRNVKDEDLLNLLLKFNCIDNNFPWENITVEQMNDFKVRLATHVTAMVRGEEAAQKAHSDALAVFSGGSSDSLPTITITIEQSLEGVRVAELAFKLGLCSSISDARRMIKNRGIKVDGGIVEDENMKIFENNFKNGQVMLSCGRKNHGVINKE